MWQAWKKRKRKFLLYITTFTLSANQHKTLQLLLRVSSSILTAIAHHILGQPAALYIIILFIIHCCIILKENDFLNHKLLLVDFFNLKYFLFVSKKTYDNTMSDGGVTFSHDVYLCENTFDFYTISGAIFILIFILSVTGNILLVCALLLYENLRNVTNLFFLNLACSDLVFTVTLPFWAVYYLHHWVFGDFVCKFMTATYITGLYSSVILLTAMTVDRFITVVLHWPSNPVQRQRWAMGSCAAAWLISTGASVNDAMKVKVETSWNNESSCEDFSDGSDVSLGYYLQVSLLFFFPFGIIIFCYSAILKTVLLASNRKRFRTVVVILTIVTVFFLCWGPYHILLLIRSLYEPIGCHETERFDTAYFICHLLAFCHCCMNPLLYMLSQKLRGHVFRILHCETGTRTEREGGTGQSNSFIQNPAFIAENSVEILELTAK